MFKIGLTKVSPPVNDFSRGRQIFERLMKGGTDDCDPSAGFEKPLRFLGRFLIAANHQH